MKNKKNKRRYYLHQVIKEFFRYSAYNRIVYVPYFFKKEDYPKKVVRALDYLRGLNYSIQIEIQ